MMRKFLYFSLVLYLVLIMPSEQQVQTLRIMSYNIHSGRDLKNVPSLPQIAKVIVEHKPDFVGLQELDINTTRSPFDMPKLLANLTNMHYTFHETIPYQGGKYGIAIMSKYPIQETAFINYVAYKGEKRSALAARINFNGSFNVWHVNTHLTLDSHERTLEVHELLKWIDTLKTQYPQDKLLITGDFNAIASETGITDMSKLFLDSWAAFSGSTRLGYTFPADVPTRRIDYVFLPMHSKVHNVVMQSTTASDHRPVFVQATV